MILIFYIIKINSSEFLVLNSSSVKNFKAIELQLLGNQGLITYDFSSISNK